ncbi:hypothetical protein PCANC_00547 [Puccinia coronata f. sp. avenae]|uniref:Uncharacterized protein n=1 Tax=Puccinia coronata f. sp. avenae TaxID=200324 RepID=A0A2N5T1C5_9BASI|nr:hypothetical protein PCANC_19463 [Puccinia coronata f. sp. avenae]PLW19311.1 hypothetical protein PCASD_15225 [Puccinia coronata f. sp. avenae]PLW48399.1 hypothetical protein PCASD_02925 [Puccinia coronata f. sp. avenae]PLW58438.1 hypothetical protein PCANC_00547 [Puccinia coronata f. sp. avenae]
MEDTKVTKVIQEVSQEGSVAAQPAKKVGGCGGCRCSHTRPVVKTVEETPTVPAVETTPKDKEVEGEKAALSESTETQADAGSA